MENKKEVFQYTYSAKRQEEIQNIRKKYLPEEEDKMERLRRLDRGTTKKARLSPLWWESLAVCFWAWGCAVQ